MQLNGIGSSYPKIIIVFLIDRQIGWKLMSTTGIIVHIVGDQILYVLTTQDPLLPDGYQF